MKSIDLFHIILFLESLQYQGINQMVFKESLLSRYNLMIILNLIFLLLNQKKKKIL